MKKIIIIALSLVAVLGIALGVVYVIDMNRMKNNIEVTKNESGEE